MTAEERLGMRQGGGRTDGRGGAADAELVARARAGDAAAYDALVRRHFERVHALLFRMVGNHEDAEDLAQECFVRGQRALALFRGEGAFVTWLFRIALHLSRDHMRSKGRRESALPLAAPQAAAEGEEEEQPAAPGGRGPSDEAARRELVAALQSALARLPHRLRAAFVLRTFEDLAYEDVGLVLGITATTARVHVMKARRLLARWMEPWIGGSER